MSAWSAVPFGAFLMAIAIVPLVAPHFWEKNRNKLILALLFALPMGAFLVAHGESHHLLESLKEYAAFIALLGSLFVITGGIHVRGSLSGTPAANTGMLALGAVLANVIGTTGASMLLIRPFLRANQARFRRTHLIVFFIFIVSNTGGLLTPLGDPPLFLGFLRKVPFTWTFQLWPIWLVVNGALLVLFNFIDQAILSSEEKSRPGSQLEEVQVHLPLRIEGSINFLWLLGVLAVNFGIGTYGERINPNPDARLGIQVTGMLAMVGLAWMSTRAQTRKDNGFTWHPIAEVAILFFAIFVTMVPALQLLQHHGASLGVSKPWHYFWATGGLSSFLDNAPTYLTMGTVALGSTGAADFQALSSHARGGALLVAISCGAVLMGANTYIGNGPNFMVKAIADEQRVPTPGFFGYMKWSLAVLIPIFIAVTFLFFRP